MITDNLTKLLLVTGITFAVSSIPVRAQVYVPPNLMSNPVLQRAMENRNMTSTAISGLIRSQMLRNSSGRASKSGRKRSAAAISPTKFAASSANSSVKKLAAQISSDPAEQKQAENIFSKCMEIYWDTANKDGFPSNDLAYAFNFFVVNNYHVYHDVYSNEDAYRYGIYDESIDPHFVQMSMERAVYKQFKDLLEGSSEIAKLTSKDKQQYTEILAIMTNVPFQVYSAGLKEKDRKMIEQSRKLAKENLEYLFETQVENIVINKDGVSLIK